MQPIDWAFLRTVAVGLGSFGLAGVAIALGFPPTRMAIVVDRSFCPPEQWQATAAVYRDRYAAHQQKSVRIERVILVGDLGNDSLSTPPPPEQFAKLATFGRSNETALQQWMSGQGLPADLRGVSVELLRCGGSAVPTTPTP